MVRHVINEIIYYMGQNNQTRVNYNFDGTTFNLSYKNIKLVFNTLLPSFPLFIPLKNIVNFTKYYLTIKKR